MKKLVRRWRLIALMVPVLTALGVVVVSSGQSRNTDAKPAWVGKGDLPNPRYEVAKEAHQAKFVRSGGNEAKRQGPISPAAEQVGNRAYPRSYVDDRLAVKGLRSFRTLPRKPTGTGAGARQIAASAVTGPWTELGPFTPNVAGPDSQFFDPRTLTGPPTQESGRVTALAIDPQCQPGACRMWVAAAGGGIWRTDDALATPTQWKPPPADLPTNAYGSLYYDAAHNVLYAGSGEPNGSGDSEAGLGLFRSTDAGASWSLVPGSASVATNRSVGAIAVDPADPTGHTIYIGTDVARHGSSAVNGGRITPPGAPSLGLYKSVDNGATFSLQTDLQTKTPPSPNPASSGTDWFQGGINKLEFDPNHPHELYAAVIGYGVWRADESAASPSWEKVFHTMNQDNFSNPTNPVGDTFGDRTEFDLLDVGGKTRAYLGDSSDDWASSGDPTLPLPEAWRVDDIGHKTGFAVGQRQRDHAADGESGLDDAVQRKQRHEWLCRLRLVPERAMRLRRLRRPSARRKRQHGLVRRLDELQRAARLRRRPADFQRPSSDPLDQRGRRHPADGQHNGQLAGHDGDPDRPAPALGRQGRHPP